MIEFNFNPFPVLETERLVLRRMTLDDAESYFNLRSDPRVTVYANRKDPANVEEIKDLITGKIELGISTNEAISWAISKKTEKEFMGTISFHKTDRNHHRAEIGYQLHFEYWKKGFMSEAVKAVINYGFTKMKLHSIEAKVNINNAASINLLKKNGFIKEGHFTEDYFYNGEYMDTGVYSLVNK